MYSLRPLECDREGRAEGRGCKSSWSLLEEIVAIIGPYTHKSSSAGKWEKGIGSFMAELVNTYLKRVGRERSIYVNASAGYNGSSSLRLGPRDDITLVNLMLPLALEGIMKKNQEIGSLYENAVADLCALHPQMSLPYIVNTLSESMEVISEPLSTIVCLKLMSRISRLLCLYSPQTLTQYVFPLASTGLDISHPLKTISVLSLFLSLMNFFPIIDHDSLYDFYGVQGLEDLLENLTPMFGFKTTENQHLFEDFKLPFSNIQNYPAERLDDKIPQTQTLGYVAPYARQKPGTQEMVSPGYQNTEEFKLMLELRSEIHATMGSWILESISKLLEMVDKINVAEAMLEDQWLDSISGLITCMCQNTSRATVEAAATIFLNWCLKQPRMGSLKFAQSVAEALGGANLFTLAIKVFQPKLFAAKNTSKEMTIWLTKILSCFIDV